MTYTRNMMRGTAAAMIMALAGLSGAQAAVPADVMAEFKAYQAAMSAKDYKKALKHGKAAWSKAETSMGDGKTTGDLAFNYGFLEKTRGSSKKAIKALSRGVELADVGREKGAEVKLERMVELASAYELTQDYKRSEKTAEDGLSYAEAKGLGNSVFAGELMVHDANACVRVVNANSAIVRKRDPNTRVKARGANKAYNAKRHLSCAKEAGKAQSIFTANPKIARPQYVALAANIEGGAYERQRDWIKAALSYQTAREAIENTYGRDNEVAQQLLGRWVNSYAHIRFHKDADKAHAAGVCKCWPYYSETDKVKVLKSASSDAPTHALRIESSGYVITEFDVSDDGKAENLRVIQSWPEGQYDKYAKKVIVDTQFAPKSGNEPADYRKNLTRVYSYIMYEEGSRSTY